MYSQISLILEIKYAYLKESYLNSLKENLMDKMSASFVLFSGLASICMTKCVVDWEVPSVKFVEFGYKTCVRQNGRCITNTYRGIH